MKQMHFWDAWLFVLSLIITLFGLLLAFFSRAPFFSLMHAQIDPLFWGSNILPEGALTFRTWIYALLGASMAGWGVTLAFLARFAFRLREAWSWKAIVLALGVWYLADTGMSLAYGVFFNAVFNTILLILVFLPLFFTRRAFRD